MPKHFSLSAAAAPAGTEMVERAAARALASATLEMTTVFVMMVPFHIRMSAEWRASH
jgi:hypothetical protein